MKQKLTITLSVILAATIIFFACKDEELPTIENALSNKIELTLAQNSVTGSFAALTCNVTNPYKISISEHGLCWNTSGNPTISDSKTEAGSFSGASFNKNIENLNPSTDYYVKAYITFQSITIYSAQVKITTTNGLPSGITTAAISNITPTTATSGGNITDDGGLEITARGVCWNTNPEPTIADAHTTDGTGTGSFTSSLTGLTEWTTYYVRAYATNSNGTAYANEISFVARNTISDYDGNIYGIVTIGNQIWMAENLKTTHYADGTAIPLVTDNTAWANLADNNTDDAYCYYNNDANSQYGALYTWAAAMNGAASSTANPSEVQGAYPDGWHLPSDAEWTELVNFIAADGYSGSEGTALKSTTGWSSDGNGTDIYGFTALPGGFRSFSNGSFDNAGSYGFWWSSTEGGSTYAYSRDLYYDYARVSRDYGTKSDGFSVRCIKD